VNPTDKLTTRVCASYAVYVVDPERDRQNKRRSSGEPR